MQIFFDVETDILEIQIGMPSETYFDEMDDDLFEGHDEKTGELKGFKILNFTKRGIKNVKIPLPPGIEINSDESD